MALTRSSVYNKPGSIDQSVDIERFKNVFQYKEDIREAEGLARESAERGSMWSMLGGLGANLILPVAMTAMTGGFGGGLMPFMTKALSTKFNPVTQTLLSGLGSGLGKYLGAQPKASEAARLASVAQSKVLGPAGNLRDTAKDTTKTFQDMSDSVTTSAIKSGLISGAVTGMLTGVGGYISDHAKLAQANAALTAGGGAPYSAAEAANLLYVDPANVGSLVDDPTMVAHKIPGIGTNVPAQIGTNVYPNIGGTSIGDIFGQGKDFGSSIWKSWLGGQ